MKKKSAKNKVSQTGKRRVVLSSLAVAAFGVGSLNAATVYVNGFGTGGIGEGGWKSDDTRNTAGVDLVGSSGVTHAPKPGVTPPSPIDADAQINTQITFQSLAGSRGNLGGLMLDGTPNNLAKSTISVINTTTGLASTTTAFQDFSVTYRWEQIGSFQGIAFRMGVQSNFFADSQDGFTASRSGESSWDLMLTYGVAGTGVNYETIDENSVLNVHQQSGNTYFGSTGKIATGTLAQILSGNAIMEPGATITAAQLAEAFIGSGGTNNAFVSNVQFGIGSYQRDGKGVLDWAKVSFLNGGDLIDFVEASLWTNLNGGEFGNGGNWQGPVPDTSVNGIFGLPGTYTVTFSTDTTVRSLGISNGQVTFDVTTGATLTLTNDGSLSVDANGTLTLQGGGSVVADRGEVYGTLNTTGAFTAGELLVDEGGVMNVRSGVVTSALMAVGTGTIAQTGGIVTNSGTLVVGAEGGTGTYNLSGGELSLNGNVYSLGQTSGETAGVGTLNLSGSGVLRVESGDFVVGDISDDAVNGNGVVNMTGGTFVVSGSATLYLAGFTPTNSGVNTFNLTGGVLEIGGNSLQANILGSTASYAFNLGNGKITVTSDLTTSVDATLLTGQTFTLDTNDFSADWNGVLSGSGNLRKSGGGTLALNGTNTYSGTTYIDEGVVLANTSEAFGTSSIVLADDTVLLSGSNGLTLANNVTVTSGAEATIDANGSIVTLTGGLDLTGATLAFGDGITNSSIRIQLSSSTVDETSSLVIRENADVRAEDGSLADMTAGLGRTHVDGAIDYQTFRAEIANLTGSGEVNFGVNALTGIEIGGGFFNGVISGPGALVKTSTNVLMLTGSNAITGATVNGGTLVTANSGALGNGSALVNSGGTLASSGTLSLSSLELAGGDIVVLPSSNSVFDVSGTMEITAPSRLLLNDSFSGPYYTAVIAAGGYTGEGLLSVGFYNPFLTGNLELDFSDSNEIRVTLSGPIVSRTPYLSNTEGYITPVTADFIVSPEYGVVETLPVDSSNTVNSLEFLPDGVLQNNGELVITSGSFTVNDGVGYLVSGTVTTPVDFNKNGDGTLITESEIIVDGAVNINRGALIVDGELTSAGDVTVFRNALFGGNGVVNSNLVNNGTVTPGREGRSLVVTGNFTQSSRGTLSVEVKAGGNSGNLIVGGTASLNGTLAITKGNYRPKKDGEKFRLLTAEGGVVGEFSDVYSYFGNTLRGFDVDYLGNAVVLEYTEGSFYEFAKDEKLSPNVRTVAKALDRAHQNDKLGKLLDTLYDTQLSDLPDQLALLSPEAFAQIFQIGFSTAQIQYGNLERRMSDVRDGAIGFSTNGLALSNSRGTLNYDGAPIVNTRDGITLAGWDGKSVVGKQNVAPIVEQSRWGFFATGSGEWADVETTAQARGSEFSTGGFTLGADYRVSDNFVVGIAGGYANTGSDLNNGGKIDVNSGRGSAYASLFGSGFYLNTTVGGAYNSYDTKRGTIGGIARGSTEGGEFNALMGGGYDYRVGGFSIGPVASLQYTYLGLSSFTESGSDAPMHFSSQSQDSLKSSLGGRISYAWNVGGIVIKPEVRAQWQHEFLDSTASVESGFVGGAGVFTVNGPNIGRDALLLDAGVSAQFSPAVSVFAYYTGEIGRTNYSSNAVNGGFRINF